MSVGICYQAADVRLARWVGEYLETNLDLKVEHALVQGGLDLLDTVETMQDRAAVIVLLSPNSLPSKVPRERWDPFLSNRFAWVLAGQCKHPPLLKRHTFVEVADDPTEAGRILRLWILGAGSKRIEVPPEAVPIVDQPGSVTGSSFCKITFFFHQTIRLDARGRSGPSLLTELASQLLLLTSGDAAELLALIREALSARRVLLEFIGQPGDWLNFPSRASIAILDPPPEPSAINEDELLAAIKLYSSGRGPEPSRAMLDRALTQPSASEVLVRKALGFLMSEHRLAEAYHLTGRPGDFEEERAWIEDRWLAGAPGADAEQLSFNW